MCKGGTGREGKVWGGGLNMELIMNTKEEGRIGDGMSNEAGKSRKNVRILFAPLCLFCICSSHKQVASLVLQLTEERRHLMDQHGLLPTHARAAVLVKKQALCFSWMLTECRVLSFDTVTTFASKCIEMPAAMSPSCGQAYFVVLGRWLILIACMNDPECRNVESGKQQPEGEPRGGESGAGGLAWHDREIR